MLRYRLWDADSTDAGTVAVDPSCVATVVETSARRSVGGAVPVAVIRLVDGKEYVVHDPERGVTAEVWLEKSVFV